MTIYNGSEPIKTIDLDASRGETSLDLDASLPADATFTLSSSFKPDEWEEGQRKRLFSEEVGITISLSQLKHFHFLISSGEVYIYLPLSLFLKVKTPPLSNCKGVSVNPSLLLS